MDKRELQLIIQELKSVDTKTGSPELALWFRELFVRCGRILRKGKELEHEIDSYIKNINTSVLADTMPYMFDDYDVEYRLYAYNKEIDYYLQNECEGKDEYEEFIEDIDEEAEDILSWYDECELILDVICEIPGTFNLWQQHFKDVSSIGRFINNHLYVRTEFADRWKAYAQSEGIPSECWWHTPCLIEERPVILPIEAEMAKIESYKTKIPEHVMVSAHEKLFGTAPEKPIIERIKEKAAAVKEKFTETLNEMIRQLQPSPLPQPATIRGPAVNAIAASATLYLSGKRPKVTVILDEHETIFCDVEIKELSFSKKDDRSRRIFNLQFDVWQGLADVRVTLNDRQGNVVSNLTDSSGECYVQDIKRGDYELVISDAANRELFSGEVKLEKEIHRIVKDDIEVILERRTKDENGYDIKVHKKTGTEVTLIDSKSRENICRPTGYARLFVFNKIPGDKYNVKFNVRKDDQEYSYAHEFDMSTLHSTTTDD